MLAETVTLPLVTIRAVATLLAVAVVLSGCTSDEKRPTVLPPAPSRSPTLAPVQVPVPPEAIAETPQGAAAFVRFFFAQINRAYQELDAGQVQALSAPQCQSCQNVVDDVKRLEGAGYRVAGDRFMILSAETRPPDAEERVIVDFRFSSDPYVEKNRSGEVAREEPAQVAKDGQVRLIREADRWMVSGIRLIGE